MKLWSVGLVQPRAYEVSWALILAEDEFEARRVADSNYGWHDAEVYCDERKMEGDACVLMDTEEEF